MLVLTRKAGESLRIGPDVRVTILAISGGQVRVGIDAPGRVTVHREEVVQRIEEANREAARSLVPTLEELAPGHEARAGSTEKEPHGG